MVVMQTSYEYSRWRRFGHDRLYVTAEGRRLGHVDLKDRSAHPEEGVGPDLLEAAAALWEEAGPAGLHAPDREAQTSPVPAEHQAHHLVAQDKERVEAPWTDLALNEPGDRLQQRAREERRAAPLKTFAARALGKHSPERAWRLGAEGEQAVAAAIERLTGADPRWRVLHGVPVGVRGADIDHLVIGPGGVITINAKNHPGAEVRVNGRTVRVNGYASPHGHSARRELERVTISLGAATGFTIAPVAVIAVANASSIKVTKSAPGVHVMAVKELTRWISALGTTLDDERVDQIFEAARKSTTWIG